MSNTDSVSAVFGLLLGLAAHSNPLVATANAAPNGPVVAIEKAHAAAAAEQKRAHASEAEAERVFAREPSGGAPAESTKAAAPSGAATKGASGDDAAANADAAAPAEGDGTVVATANAPYEPAAHRDPFRPPNVTGPVADKGTPRTPLEAYEIGQLKLVGIVREGGTMRAMVEDSAGLGYIVTAGTAIGSSGGVVRTIEERRLLISETTTDFYGEKQAKEVVMELPQEDRSP